MILSHSLEEILFLQSKNHRHHWQEKFFKKLENLLMPTRLKPVQVHSVLPPFAITTKLTMWMPWVCEGISHRSVEQPNPKGTGAQGTPPLLACILHLSMWAPKRSRTKASLWTPGFHACQKTVWGQEKTAHSRSYASPSLSTAVQLWVNRPWHYHTNPRQRVMLKSSLRDTWPLCPLMSFLSPYAL